MTTLLQGHTLDVLKTLPEKSIHCAVTSPPYFGLRSYGCDGVEWAAVSYSPMAGLPEIHTPEWTGSLGLEPDISMFVGHLVLIFREVWRVLNDRGTLWLNLGDSYASVGKWGGSTSGKHSKSLHGDTGVGRGKRSYGALRPKSLLGIPWRVAFALQADGWILRSDIIWAKKNPMPESVTDRPTKAHEYVFLLAKSKKYFYDQEAVREQQKPESQARYKAQFMNSEKHISGGYSPTGAIHTAGMKQYNPAGRNRRSVWLLSSEPYRGAHFATFPTKLVLPCLKAGTSERGVCPICGAQWQRVVERKPSVKSGSSNNLKLQSPSVFERGGNQARYGQVGSVSTKTTGWQPTCTCTDEYGDIPEPVPARTLDPFVGSGTVGVVAKQLGIDFTGIDLSAEYLKLAEQRINTAQPTLFELPEKPQSVMEQTSFEMLEEKCLTFPATTGGKLHTPIHSIVRNANKKHETDKKS